MESLYYVVGGQVTTDEAQAKSLAQAKGLTIQSGYKDELKQNGIDVTTLPRIQELRQ